MQDADSIVWATPSTKLEKWAHSRPCHYTWAASLHHNQQVGSWGLLTSQLLKTASYKTASTMTGCQACAQGDGQARQAHLAVSSHIKGHCASFPAAEDWSGHAELFLAAVAPAQVLCQSLEGVALARCLHRISSVAAGASALHLRLHHGEGVVRAQGRASMNNQAAGSCRGRGSISQTPPQACAGWQTCRVACLRLRMQAASAIPGCF